MDRAFSGPEVEDASRYFESVTSFLTQVDKLHGVHLGGLKLENRDLQNAI